MFFQHVLSACELAVLVDWFECGGRVCLLERSVHCQGALPFARLLLPPPGAPPHICRVNHIPGSANDLADKLGCSADLAATHLFRLGLPTSSRLFIHSVPWPEFQFGLHDFPAGQSIALLELIPRLSLTCRIWSNLPVDTVRLRKNQTHLCSLDITD